MRSGTSKYAVKGKYHGGGDVYGRLSVMRDIGVSVVIRHATSRLYPDAAAAASSETATELLQFLRLKRLQ